MKHPHITEWLDQRSPEDWPPADFAFAEQHIADCEDCRAAWFAWQAARALLQARAVEQAPVPLGFVTRVMAGVREIPSPALPLVKRLWMVSARMVYGLAAVTLVLVLLAVREEMAQPWPAALEPELEIGSMVIAYDQAMGAPDESGIDN